MKNATSLHLGLHKTDDNSAPFLNTKENDSATLNVILTGVTGAVGSHILFELLKSFAEKEYLGKIVILARPNSKTGQTALQRVHSIISSDHAPNYLKKYTLETLFSFIEVIQGDLSDSDLNIHISKYKHLVNCHVIHSAATTNLSKSDKAYAENYKINYCGSMNLLEACKDFASKFCFISTAYSCGIQNGLIPNDYNSIEDKTFRNHYEKIKTDLEIELEDKCKTLGIKLQILRPAIVCGRLLDAPLYRIANFSVFYAYGKFFYSGKGRNDIDTIRVESNTQAALHVIPVDYVAKVIVKAITNDNVQFLNIAPQKGYNAVDFLTKVTQRMGYENVDFCNEVNREETDNPTQALYYKMIHSSFGDYINTNNFEFDITPLSDILPDIEIPNSEAELDKLLDFAKECKFNSLESIDFAKAENLAIPSPLKLAI